MLKTLFRSAVAIVIALVSAKAVSAGRGRRKATNAEARTTNPLVMLISIPDDVRRYLKLKSM